MSIHYACISVVGGVGGGGMGGGGVERRTGRPAVKCCHDQSAISVKRDKKSNTFLIWGRNPI